MPSKKLFTIVLPALDKCPFVGYIIVMKEKKTFKFTVAPNKANRMAGWTSTIEAYGILWALTKLKERGLEVKKIEEAAVK